MSKEIKISEVLEMIEAGKTRPEIREYYGLSVREMTVLSNHPLIKGKKAKTPVNINIIDDVSEIGEEEQSESLSEEPVENAESLEESEPMQEATEVNESKPEEALSWEN